jgi:hypothetical protein
MVNFKHGAIMLVPNTEIAVQNQSGIITAELHDNLAAVARQIDELITEQHAANILALWRIGGLVHEVDNNPTQYLKPEQLSQHAVPSMLLFKAFDRSIRPEQFETARSLFEAYSTPAAIESLIQKRCPAKPGWRITVSHVQLLLTVPDPDQRKVLENLCAQEAYTTKALAVELHERKGPAKMRERSPTAPKGLKQRVYDLVDHQKKFIARSEKLWLSEDGLYDAIANAPPERITETIRGYVTEAIENFEKMHELIQSHQTMCRRISELIEQAPSDDPPEENYAGHTIVDAIASEAADKIGVITR